ncbi:bifunctional folylpolyglutamate synthase/dihydrofolate synthase [Acidicapsa ligni]|uniref:bifunctional folylpolyglutamate synthase/dihydrofolate synthase n=1 Tax=Acidicapsa ligni TaxID=542300 RepID=UPI0021E0BE5A|nr:folylpolyglutamate synthase/dihydrofolate synthase family protein [Acidicapsa ligni]
MSYIDAITNLNALTAELFSAPGVPRRKFSLNEIGILCAALGNPHLQYPSVLIAGTNGKGSTASTLASIARESGLRVGLYTSPHLDRVNERIRLLLPQKAADDSTIPNETFGRLYFRVHDAARQLVADGKLPAFPSYFELLTALGFLYFAESKIDLAVLEVGMGGRLDATNLVDPILSVITDISLDHQEWLGSTIAEIAREKAGILRANGTLITLPQHPEANQALGEVAVALNVRGIPATEYMPIMSTDPLLPYQIEALGRIIQVDSPLKGAHQHRNLALAIATAVELSESGRFPITPEAIEKGIHNTSWPGRIEQISLPNQPEFLLDVAHNPAGAWALRSALSASAVEGQPQILIFACLRDKPLREMTQILFPLFDHVVLAPIHSPRATDVADLTAAAEATGIPAHPSQTVAEALQIATEIARSLLQPNHPPARIVVSGSVYLVGEARHLLLAKTASESRPGAH